MKLCDLHTHSVFSDGTYTPTQLIDKAVKQGLAAIALCDHNTVDGIPEFLAAAKDQPIEAIAGAEFTVDYEGKELHLLGLFIPQERLADVSRLTEEVNRRKRQSNMELIEALNKAGYAIDFEDIEKATPMGKFNRAHIAAELTRKGYCTTISQAMSTLLDPKAGYYKAPARLNFWRVLDFLNAIGVAPVLAHPLENLTPQELEELLPQAKARGLRGIECEYALYTPEKTRICKALADLFQLKYSGGSDFHGSNKPGIELGTGKGNLKIPYEWVSRLADKFAL